MSRLAICIGLVWVALTLPALAHDPGLSGACLQLERDQLVATLNFAPSDASGLDADALDVQLDGLSIRPSKTTVTRAAISDVQLQAVYELPVGRMLNIRSTRLWKLARGHHQYCSVIDGTGRILVRRLLDAHEDAVQLDLTNVASTADPSPFGRFLQHGFVHILTGYDHLLFIMALALAAATFLDLLKVIGMFTLAHSVTLTLSACNIVHLSPKVVEPMIAASIVFVAVSNVWWPKRAQGSTRLGITFVFGLFHGLGFAGGLLSAMQGFSGISGGLAIIAFSLGVELGHQLVVLPFFAILRRACPQSRLPTLRYGSTGIALAGMYWLVGALR